MDCNLCVYNYYEPDTNYRECTNPKYQDGQEVSCPGYYNKDDAKADAKYNGCDKY